MNLLDNTLRDGANLIGHGFNAELTISMVKGLLNSGIKDIEVGNCAGLGAYDQLGLTKALSDEEYFKILAPYMDKGRIGMFLVPNCAEKERIQKAANAGLDFLRVGACAGDGAGSIEAIKLVKNAGLTCRYALTNAYISTPEELASEAKMLEDAGVDKISIMDSAGTMFPQDTANYVSALKNAVSIPVGFHGHSSLSLSQANALSAVAAGADEIDCGLLGMACGIGNCCTELAVATLKKQGYLPEVDFYKLLEYLDNELIPAMKPYDYHVVVTPVYLMMGLVGCHPCFIESFQKVAEEEDVSLYHLISEVAAINRKDPDEKLMYQVAATLK